PLAAIVKSENNFLADGYRLIDEKKYAEARAILKKAVEYDPLDDETHIMLADVQIKLLEYDKATENLKKALELKPENDLAYQGLALISIYKNNFNEAYQLLCKAITYKINSRGSYELLGRIYQNSQLFDDAIRNYELSVQYDDNPSEFLFTNLGICYAA